MCTDGAPAMLGCCSGFQALAKQKSPDIISIHSTIYHQALIMKTVPDEMNSVLGEVIRAVNLIKRNLALNSCSFTELCKGSDSELLTLLLHSHVRWLAKGMVLKRVFILHKEIQQFLMNTKQDMHAIFSDVRFLLSLSFFVDIFEFVNCINLALQGRENTVLHFHEKLSAFKMKPKLWNSKLEKKIFAPFSQLNTHNEENEINVHDNILEMMKRHVSILCEEITHYFPDLEEFGKYHPFINKQCVLSSINDLPSENNLIQEQFIDFINDEGAKHVFRETSCRYFGIVMAHSYPDVAKMALEVLTPFANNNECEAAFSTFACHQNKIPKQIGSNK